jgi:DnaJ-class molecular chaperone
VSCHRTDYDHTANPSHSAAGYSTDCVSCHTSTTTWLGSNFNHGTTQFPLTGAHVTVSCASCHSDGVFKGKPTACVACHRPDYDHTTTPAHAAAGYSTDCTTCHTTNAWQGASFNHDTTQFPLTGGHVAVSCASCHGDGVYHGKSTACVSCHQPDYDRTTTPPHGAAAFATACATCHTTATWQGATFNHGATQFPLVGAHLSASCAACHGDGVYRGKPTTCVSCHRADYDQTSTPAHAAAGYSTDCTTCHTGTVTWQGAVFDHNTTQFPLTGAHLAVACSSCHADGVFKGKPTTCESCHLPQYTTTSTPPHAAAGFSTSCTTCHSSTTWLTSSWSHAATGWSLTGVHAATACASCHGDGVYHGKSTTCSSCHLNDYNATVNPNHRAATFPTACESCHTTTTWLGATFDHDGSYFPIYSGSHKGRWTTCTDCHTTSSNYTVFSCLTCHLQPTTDSHHRGTSGYHYQSSACYSCHPRGRAG